jgi:hypothetical protein
MSHRKLDITFKYRNAKGRSIAVSIVQQMSGLKCLVTPACVRKYSCFLETCFITARCSEHGGRKRFEVVRTVKVQTVITCNQKVEAASSPETSRTICNTAWPQDPELENHNTNGDDTLGSIKAGNLFTTWLNISWWAVRRSLISLVIQYFSISNIVFEVIGLSLWGRNIDWRVLRKSVDIWN